MKKALVVAMALLGATASAANWVVLKDDAYGYGMLMPEGTRTKSRDFGGGWGGGYAKYGVTEFAGIAKLGSFPRPEEIETFAIKTTGIPARHWTKLDEGQNNPNGWKWYRTYRANSDTHVLFVVVGTGPRGSYCMFLKTTIEDFKTGEAAYVRWYNSLTVY